MNSLETIKNALNDASIAHYDNLLNLFEENVDNNIMDKLSDEMKEYFKGFLDYESIQFIVIDCETVIVYDSINGDIINITDIEKLLDDSIFQYESENGKIQVVFIPEKYIDLDIEESKEHEIVVFESYNGYESKIKMQEFEKSKPHGNGMYYLNTTI